MGTDPDYVVFVTSGWGVTSHHRSYIRNWAHCDFKVLPKTKLAQTISLYQNIFGQNILLTSGQKMISH